MKLIPLPTNILEEDARKIAKEIVASLPPVAQAVVTDTPSLLTIDCAKGRIFTASFANGAASVQAAEGLLTIRAVKRQ